MGGVLLTLDAKAPLKEKRAKITYAYRKKA